MENGIAARIAAPRSLSALGQTGADLPHAVDLATANSYWPATPVKPTAIAALLSPALAGAPQS